MECVIEDNRNIYFQVLFNIEVIGDSCDTVTASAFF